jgi:hypothetical protein
MQSDYMQLDGGSNANFVKFHTLTRSMAAISKRNPFPAAWVRETEIRTAQKQWKWFVNGKNPKPKRYRNAVHPFRYRQVQYMENKLKYIERMAILKDL